MPEWTGPLEDWRIDWATYGGPYIRYPGWPHPENGHAIATLHFADPTPFEEKRKRASLIAAAPDLLDALRVAREFIAGELATSLRDACVVRDGVPDRSTMDELCAPYIDDCDARLARIDTALAKAGIR